jgi:deoxyadenosine/deoxycytidine kinase
VSLSALIGLSGPVGTGKSTIVTDLASHLGFKAWPERVAGNPFFTRFLDGKAEWAFCSQAAFLINATEDAANARGEGVGGVLERPPQEMLGVFVRTLAEDELLNPHEVRLLTELVALSERLSGVPDVLVVLRATPETLLERIRARGATDKNAYSPGDLEQFSKAYDSWVSDWTRSPVLEVDVETRDLRDPGEMTRLAEEVRETLAGRGVKALSRE